jgi:hypothetical protein
MEVAFAVIIISFDIRIVAVYKLMFQFAYQDGEISV